MLSSWKIGLKLCFGSSESVGSGYFHPLPAPQLFCVLGYFLSPTLFCSCVLLIKHVLRHVRENYGATNIVSLT
jgi:hypothetical protein